MIKVDPNLICTPTTRRFIGLMSGTSLDHIDGALVAFQSQQLTVIATHRTAIPKDLRQICVRVMDAGAITFPEWIQLDQRWGQVFATHVLDLLQHHPDHVGHIEAIGCHGQTLWHQPDGPHRSSLQVGDPHVLVTQTGITTVHDFRRRDMAWGGQGAPLAPGLHQHLFHDPTQSVAVINIGGIANVSLLPQATTQPVTGFDCGPGNTLLDRWCQQHLGAPYDDRGRWALTGQIHPRLWHRLHADPYFKRSPPKSTGREYFNLAWLNRHLQGLDPIPADVQRTLLHLTATTIKEAVLQAQPDTACLLLCGGGADNDALVQALRQQVHPIQVLDSEQRSGLAGSHLEPVLMAWLAKQAIDQRPGNVPTVTGAAQEAVLGSIHWPDRAHD